MYKFDIVKKLQLKIKKKSKVNFIKWFGSRDYAKMKLEKFKVLGNQGNNI